MKEYKLTQYRDAHLKDFIYFWTLESIRVSPIYHSPEEADTWDRTVIDLT